MMRRLALQIELGQFQIARLRDLEICGRAQYDGHLRSGTLHQAGLVGADEFIGWGLGKGAPEEMAAETLGSLRLHDVFAGNGGGDDGSVGGALDLLDGVDGGQADDGSVVLFDGADGALDGGCVDERTDSVVNKDDVVGVAFDGIERIRYALLAIVTAFNDMDPAGESVVTDLRRETVHFARAHGHIHGSDPWHFGKCTQSMDENRDASQFEELLGGYGR